MTSLACELQVLDWATVAQRSSNPDLWDAYIVIYNSFLGPTISPRLRRDSAWGGWNCDPDMARLVHAVDTKLQYEKRCGIIRLSVWQSREPGRCEKKLGDLCWGLTVLPLIRT